MAGDNLDPEYSSEHRSPHLDKSSLGLRPSSNSLSTPTDTRVRASFESKDSRPTSPHNVSSPTLWNSPQTFLSVPGRRRGQSCDTNGTAESTTSMSELTYVNTATTPGSEHPPRLSEDNQKRLGAGDHPVLTDEEALQPDAGTEADFHRDNNPFAFAPGHMTKFLNPKSLGAFHAVGGLAGLEKGLRTDRSSGLSMDESRIDGTVSFDEAVSSSSPSSDTTATETQEVASQQTIGMAGTGSFEDRQRIFGANTLPEKKTKSIWQLMWLAYNDKVLIVLTVAAVIALALGLYQALGLPEGGVEWIEGVAIIVAIAVVVIVGALNDYQKERQFAKLNKKKEDREVKVVRSGKTQEVDIAAVFVGDLLLVEPGDILPVDGIFVTGHGVKCDESSATGESDVLKKTPADVVYRAMEANEPLKKLDPFMISGAKVTEGYGRMLVTAVGINSSMGKTMMALQDSNEATPLQMKLNGLAEYIAKLGSAAALLLFVVLLIKFLAQLSHNNSTPAQKGQEFMTILITAVTIVVVAVPEGLPLAVTLALAYATKRMLKDRNLVRVLRSCETMGNATTVCSDKTGTLTQNVMTLVAGSIGTANRFSTRPGEASDGRRDIDGVTISESVDALAKSVRNLWKDSIAINSTAFEGEEGGFVGSKTESALLDFAKANLGMDRLNVERGNAEVVQMIPFDSSRKSMGMVIKLKEKSGYRLLVKGASEIMLGRCSFIIRDPTQGIEAVNMSGENWKMLQSLIDAYADRSLRTIGFIYRDFESWPPRGVRRQEDDKSQAVFEDVCKQMTFLAVVGIQDPLREGVPQAVQDCIMAGVFPRMVTGDNIHTAKAIARECGIYTAGGVAIEGPEFRKMTRKEQEQIIPKLQVLARSSPEDKRTLVKRLKAMGETVAVTGDGTNDAPALKAADVGFSMNISGTEVAKEASDIVLMDDNFASIVNAIMWGRAVNDAVRKFLQFQITVNITAVMLAFISAVSNSQEESVLSAVQLLWVNLIMDTMAALALATDPPTRKILNRKPEPKSAPLISVTMWKMIIGQAIYQLTVTLILYFAGDSIFNYNTVHAIRSHRTLVFNTFVWMQIFNALNSRRLDNHFNVLEGVFNNWMFCAIFMTMISGQVLIIFVGGWPAFQSIRQTGPQWAIALILGAISLPIGAVVRLVPDSFASALVPGFIKKYASRRKDKVVVTDEENPFEFNQGLYEIKQELAFIKRYRGGRLNTLRFAMSHPKEALLHSRSPSRSRTSSSLPHTPNNELSEGEDYGMPNVPPTPDSRRSRRGRSRSNSALAGAAMAGIIAGSIGGGWSPIERREGDADSLRFARDRSKSDLSKEVRVDSHPDTRKNHPLIFQEFPVESASQATPSQSPANTHQFEQHWPHGGKPSTLIQPQGSDPSEP